LHICTVKLLIEWLNKKNGVSLSLDHLRWEVGATSARRRRRAASQPSSCSTSSGSTPFSFDLDIFSQASTTVVPVAASTGLSPAQKNYLGHAPFFKERILTGGVNLVGREVAARFLQSVALAHDHSLHEEAREGLRLTQPPRPMQKVTHEACVVQVQHRYFNQINVNCNKLLCRIGNTV